VRVGNWLPGVENPDPEHRVRVRMKNDHQVQQQRTLHDSYEKDIGSTKLNRLVRLLAQQEALDYVKKTGTIETEVQQ